MSVALFHFGNLYVPRKRGIYCLYVLEDELPRIPSQGWNRKLVVSARTLWWSEPGLFLEPPVKKTYDWVCMTGSCSNDQGCCVCHEQDRLCHVSVYLNR